MRALVYGAALAATLSTAYADTTCKTVVDIAQAIKLKAGTSEDAVFTGPDAKDFFSAMTRLLGPMPSTPKDLAAVSTHLYAGADGKPIASVHFYGGTDRCDVGFDADMTPGILNLIVGKVGVRI